MIPTPDQAAEIIQRGRRAAALMMSDVFNDAIADLSTYHLSAMAAARPGEDDREARDYHHLMHYALSELVTQLKTQADAGAELEITLGAEPEDD